MHLLLKVKRHVKLRTLLTEDPFATKRWYFLWWYKHFSLPPSPLWSILSNGRRSICILQHRKFYWEGRRGGGVAKAVISCTSHMSQGRLRSADTFPTCRMCVCTAAVTRGSKLLPSPTLLMAQHQHPWCGVCAAFLHREMQGMCTYFKIHLPSKKAKSRGGHFAPL